MKPVYPAKLESAIDRLKKSHLKVTQARIAILGHLTENHGPFTIEEIHNVLKTGQCDLVTVYRSLAAMEDAMIVRRCEFGDGASRFEYNEDGHHHHHVVCKLCRKVELLDLCLVEGLEKLVRERGYTQVTHSLEFFGICQACQKNQASK